MAEKSELEQLVADIKKSTKQVSVNKVDELKVMKAMLNDKNFSLSVYDKNMGYLGQKCPHDNAVRFVKNVIAGATGLDSKDSQHLAENYEFTKRDASFLIENMKDFVEVYTSTGRKMNIMQSAATEAYIYTKPVAATTKCVPDRDNPGEVKKITTSPYIKLVSSTKCPKYTDEGK